MRYERGASEIPRNLKQLRFSQTCSFSHHLRIFSLFDCTQKIQKRQSVFVPIQSTVNQKSLRSDRFANTRLFPARQLSSYVGKGWDMNVQMVSKLWLVLKVLEYNKLLDCKKEVLKDLKISQLLLAVIFLHRSDFSIEQTIKASCILIFYLRHKIFKVTLILRSIFLQRFNPFVSRIKEQSQGVN